MKKIAKGISLFLIMFILLLQTILTCYATEETIVVNEPTVSIENLLGTKAVDIYYEDYVIYIENQSSENISGFLIKVVIDGEKKVITEMSDLKGFERLNINLTQHFTEEFMNGKDIAIEIRNGPSHLEVWVIVILIIYMIWLW